MYPLRCGKPQTTAMMIAFNREILMLDELILKQSGSF